jgi:hypothetical protein
MTPGRVGYPPTMDEQKDGQVSEVSALGDADEPIQPADAVAGAPDQSAGEDRPQEGTTGPDAPPEDGDPEDVIEK